LSQLRKVGKPKIGEPQTEVKLSWPDFVQLVLDLTVQAYQAMREDGIAQQDWEENVFTIRLGEDYIRPIAFEAALRINIRDKVHTEEMKMGKQKTISAKEIDLSLFSVWEKDYLKVKFVWEAKRIGDKGSDSSFGNLISEYVNEAIFRFIRCEYAAGLDDAGILGYVIDGNVENIVFDINRSMSNLRVNPPLPQSNHLTQSEPIRNFKDIYKTYHIRTDSTNIKLHHLFLVFDY